MRHGGVCAQHRLPFASGKEAAAASSAKSGFENGIYNFLRSHFKSVCKTLVCTAAKSFIKTFGVNYAASMESDFLLFFIERNLVLFCDFFAGFGVNIKKSFNNFAADNVFFDDFFDIFLFNKAIENVFRENADERSLGARPKQPTLRTATFSSRPFSAIRRLHSSSSLSAPEATQPPPPQIIR